MVFQSRLPVTFPTKKDDHKVEKVTIPIIFDFLNGPDQQLLSVGNIEATVESAYVSVHATQPDGLDPQNRGTYEISVRRLAYVQDPIQRLGPTIRIEANEPDVAYYTINQPMPSGPVVVRARYVSVNGAFSAPGAPVGVTLNLSIDARYRQ